MSLRDAIAIVEAKRQARQEALKEAADKVRTMSALLCSGEEIAAAIEKLAKEAE